MSIPFDSAFHDYLPGHRSIAVVVTFNKSTCRIFLLPCYGSSEGGKVYNNIFFSNKSGLSLA